MTTEQTIEIQNLLGRHIVSLRCTQRTNDQIVDGSEGSLLNLSAFVFKLRNDWFLLTAGHVLEQIEKARAAGSTFTDFYLDDGYAPNAPFKALHTLPRFGFDEAVKNYMNHPKIGDYAAIHLRPYYCNLLNKNNIEPFSLGEMATTTDWTKFDALRLIGLPVELMGIDGNGDNARHKSQLVVIETVPMGFDNLPDAIKSEVQEKGHSRDNFFARIPNADELTDNQEPGLENIEGMSGGPIIGWRRDTNGRLGYSLVAIQSSWWDKSRIIMAGPAARYIHALDQTIQAASAKVAAMNSDTENSETG